MSDFIGRAYRIPGKCRRVFEHRLRELVASLDHLPEFAHDIDTKDEVGEVVVTWKPAKQKGAAA